MLFNLNLPISGAIIKTHVDNLDFRRRNYQKLFNLWINLWINHDLLTDFNFYTPLTSLCITDLLNFLSTVS